MIHSNTTGMPMRKDNVEWLELAKFSQQSFFNRRVVEWKLSFGYWGFVVSFTAAFLIKDTPITISKDFLDWLSCSYLIIWVASALTWQRAIQVAHSTDKQFMHYYLEMAEGRPSSRPAAPIRLFGSRCSKQTRTWKTYCCLFCTYVCQKLDINWTWYFAHVLISFLFFAGSYFILDIIN